MLDSVWSNLFKKSNLQVRDYLKKVPIFNDLTNSELKKLERYMIARNYMQNEYVFHELEPGAGMYIITSGEVRICLEPEKGTCRDLAYLSESDFFGEMALLDESPRSAAAVAATEHVSLLSFFRGDLLKVKDDYPDIACKILWNIGTVISERLRTNNELLRDSQQK